MIIKENNKYLMIPKNLWSWTLSLFVIATMVLSIRMIWMLPKEFTHGIMTAISETQQENIYKINALEIKIDILKSSIMPSSFKGRK